MQLPACIRTILLSTCLLITASSHAAKQPPQFLKHRERAIKAVKEKDFKTANKHFNMALAYQPDDPACLKAAALTEKLLKKKYGPVSKLPDRFFYVRGGAEYYEWHEFINSETLLIESGMLYFAELEGGYTHDQVKWFRYRAKGFGNDVDYDGQFQNGTPLQTTVDYAGMELAVDGDFTALINNGNGDLLNLYLGFGFRGWQRDLNGAGGYTEQWQTYYISTGLWGRHLIMNNDNVQLSGRMELRLPVYNHEKVDFTDFSGTHFTLHPGWAPSLYGSLEMQAWNLSLKLYAQALYFSESDPEMIAFDPSTGITEFAVQPESLGLSAGLSLGLAF